MKGTCYAAAFLLLSVCAYSPTTPMMDVDFEPYWPELDLRVGQYFRSQGVQVPVLPTAATMEATGLSFYMVPEDQTSRGTCDFLRREWLVKVSKESYPGCVVHELGHAALAYINHPCWDVFEHPDEVCRPWTN